MVRFNDLRLGEGGDSFLRQKAPAADSTALCAQPLMVITWGWGRGELYFKNRTAPLQMFATLKIRGRINTELLCSSGVQAGRRQEREGEGEGSIQAKTREESLSSLGNYF